MVVGPIPKRLERRMAVNAARSEPALPSEKASPMTPADSPSSRTRYTRMTANATFEKKFEVLVQPAWARRLGFPRTKRRPSRSSVHMLGLAPSAAVVTGGSGARMRSRKRPDPRKLIASTRIA